MYFYPKFISEVDAPVFNVSDHSLVNFSKSGWTTHCAFHCLAHPAPNLDTRGCNVFSVDLNAGICSLGFMEPKAVLAASFDQSGVKVYVDLLVK